MVAKNRIKYDRVIGIDLGNGMVKVYSIYEDGQKYELVIPSVYAFKDEVGEDVHDKKLNLDTYRIDDVDYVWGKDITELSNVIATSGSEGRYITDAFNVMARIVMARAVHDLEISPKENILIVTGVPSDETNTEREEQIARAFKGENDGIHSIPVDFGEDDDSDKMIFQVANVEVMGQAVSAVLAEYLNDKGFVADERIAKMKVAVVDIGAVTTDLDIVNALRRQGNYKSVPSGFTTIYGYMFKAIKQKYPSHDVPDHMLKECLKNKEYKPSELKPALDLEPSYKQGVNKLMTKIQQGVVKVWSDQTDIDKILLIGASAEEFEEKLKGLLVGLTIPKKPEMCNAIGYFRMGMNIKVGLERES